MINESFVIEGGKKLNGTVHVQTSKNATLPILASTIMVNGKVVIKNPPKITDVDNMFSILKSLGANVEEKKIKL